LTRVGHTGPHIWTTQGPLGALAAMAQKKKTIYIFKMRANYFSQ
jgi:hypothetical protein